MNCIDHPGPITTIEDGLAAGPMVLEAFEVSSTYGGLLAGTREYHSEQLRLELAAAYPTSDENSGFSLVLPEGDVLPIWECRAHLDSRQGFHEADAGSFLRICWFVDDLNQPIQELLIAVLRHVDWRSSARAYSVTDF